ncbi:MAG: response regulator [Alphaproteobacteria bacterium]|nr:response regulator [Alphaproteobacteria bacterium]
MARILMIEDEALIALALEHALTERGHEIVGVVPSAIGAVTLAGAADCDVVLADVNLGAGPDGLWAAEEIRRHHDLPFVFHTACRTADVKQRAAAIGCPIVLKKGTDVTLLDLVLRAVAHPRSPAVPVAVEARERLAG